MQAGIAQELEKKLATVTEMLQRHGEQHKHDRACIVQLRQDLFDLKGVAAGLKHSLNERPVPMADAKCEELVRSLRLENSLLVERKGEVRRAKVSGRVPMLTTRVQLERETMSLKHENDKVLLFWPYINDNG